MAGDETINTGFKQFVIAVDSYAAFMTVDDISPMYSLIYMSVMSLTSMNLV